jgi:hypothetical protein
MSTAPQSDDPQVRPPAKPAAPAPQLTLWAVVALGFVPVSVLLFFEGDWLSRTCGLVFVAGIGIHCRRLRRCGRSAAASAITGAWLLPVLIAAYEVIAFGFPWTWTFPVLNVVVWFPIIGLILGFLTGKLFEATFFLGTCFLDWLRRPRLRAATSRSLSERIDEVSTPLEWPPSFCLPRRFGIRGLLIVVTWAAMLMGCLRALKAEPSVYFVVLTFVAGVLAAQVLLFRGRDPLKSSMWGGAFLLPAALFVVECIVYFQSPYFYGMAAFAGGCICLVPAGILLGAVVGLFCGMIYDLSDEFLLWVFGGLPEIHLEPMDEADIDVLFAWIRGPKLCRRWAGGQLTYPLDRKQLLDRLATTLGDRPARLMFKAVDVRNGNMVGYVEIGPIDHVHRQARLELPLLDPTASERGRLGVALLQATVNKALRKLGIRDLGAAPGSDQAEFAACCHRIYVPEQNRFRLVEKPER